MKKKNQSYEELCSAYLEQELTREQKLQFERHLKSSPELQTILERMMALRTRLRQVRTVQSSGDFETILRARIQMTKNIGQGRLAMFMHRYRVPTLAVSMTAVIAAIIFFHFNETSEMSMFGVAAGAKGSYLLQTARIQPGDVLYAVDLVTLPDESIFVRVPNSTNEAMQRSMIIARGDATADSTAAGVQPQRESMNEQARVSF